MYKTYFQWGPWDKTLTKCINHVTQTTCNLQTYKVHINEIKRFKQISRITTLRVEQPVNKTTSFKRPMRHDSWELCHNLYKILPVSHVWQFNVKVCATFVCPINIFFHWKITIDTAAIWCTRVVTHAGVSYNRVIYITKLFPLTSLNIYRESRHVNVLTSLLNWIYNYTLSFYFSLENKGEKNPKTKTVQYKKNGRQKQLNVHAEE